MSWPTFLADLFLWTAVMVLGTVTLLDMLNEGDDGDDLQ